jgi:hypothetical protein
MRAGLAQPARIFMVVAPSNAAQLPFHTHAFLIDGSDNGSMVEHLLHLGVGNVELADILAGLLLSVPILAIVGGLAPIVPAAAAIRAGMIWAGMQLHGARQLAEANCAG